MARVVVILGEAFADFTGGDANDRVGIGVVAGRAAEDIHADGSFFDLVGVAFEGLFHHETEEGRVALALEEEGVSEKQFELGEDRGFVCQ